MVESHSIAEKITLHESIQVPMGPYCGYNNEQIWLQVKGGVRY